MESKNYHFNVSNPELISKIERFNEYGFANRTDFFLEAIKAYDTIFTPENSLKKLITDAVMDGIVGALNIETINEQIQNIAQKKDTLCRRMYN